MCQPPAMAAPFTDFEEGVALEDAEQHGELFDLPAKLRISPLNRRFGWAPASVLHAGDRRWQARKRQWQALGIESAEVQSQGPTATSTPR